jgi:ADP-ribosylglycohydrolase
LIGLALGDALGAHVEFRPRQYLVENPVKDLQPGGTWGLKKGQVFMKILCLKLTPM